MKMLRVLCCLIFAVTTSYSQNDEPNVILITLDGFRWQELFEGPDSILLLNKRATKDERVAALYWNSKPGERRRMLMPFMWSEIASNGQLIGNRNFNNKAD